MTGNTVNENELEYVGFWARVGAQLIDLILIIAITGPTLTLYYGDSYWENWQNVLLTYQGSFDFLLKGLLPAIVVIRFWVVKQATPGKMVVRAKIVDAQTGRIPSTAQYIGRYLAYFVSGFVFCLGFIWIAFDSRKQGWHDKLAGTVVVSRKVVKQKEVTFDDN